MARARGTLSAWWIVAIVAGTFGAATADEPTLDLPALPDVPKLVTTAPSRVVIDQGRALNIAGLTLHRAKKYDAAIAKYVEALKVDPSNTIARYNLASAFVSKGEPKKALAVLAQFRVQGCALCSQRLRDAQTDKEWQPVWTDAVFKAIAGTGAQASTTTGGTPSPVVNVQIETEDDDRENAVEEPLVSDHVRVHVWTELVPGFYTSPALEIALRGPAGIVARTASPPVSANHRAVEITVPGAGYWAIDVVQAGKTVDTVPLLAREIRCLGGDHSLSLSTSPPTDTSSDAERMGYSVENDTSATLTFVHHGINTGDGAAVVEWWRAGKRIVTQTVSLERTLDANARKTLEQATRADQLAKVCPLTFQTDRLTLPDEVRTKPGAWDVKIYERDAQAYLVHVSWKKGAFSEANVTAAPIPTRKDLAFEKPADPQTSALASELRAMLRSTEAVQARLALNTARLAGKSTTAADSRVKTFAQAHGQAFTDAELPVPVTATPFAHAHVRSRFLPTPRLPAISPDGTTIAFNQELEFAMFGGQCSPPSGDLIELSPVGTAATASTVSLAKFEPLTCGIKKLPGGFKVVQPDSNDSMHYQLRDAKGAVVADLVGNGNGAELCASTKRRVVVLLVHYGVGGDCDVVGGYGVQSTKY